MGKHNEQKHHGKHMEVVKPDPEVREVPQVREVPRREEENYVESTLTDAEFLQKNVPPFTHLTFQQLRNLDSQKEPLPASKIYFHHHSE